MVFFIFERNVQTYWRKDNSNLGPKMFKKAPNSRKLILAQKFITARILENP